MKHLKKALSTIPVLYLIIFFLAPPVRADFPIATTAGNEFSLGFAFDGTNYLIGIHGDETNDASITAQLISPTGALVGSRISVGRTGEVYGGPFVAFDGTNYLLLWTDDANAPNHDIYGQFISTSGALVGAPFAVVQTDGYQQLGGVVFEGTNYFLVWSDLNYTDLDANGQCDSPGEGTCRDIYGQFLTPAGALLGPVVSISAGAGQQHLPTVYFDGTRHLVAWVNQGTGPGYQHWNVYAQFINTSGTLLGSPVVVSETQSPSYNPIGISHDGTNYLLVWNHDTGPGFGAPTIWDVYGRRLSFTDGLLGPEFTISSAAGSQTIPILTFDGTNFIVTWTDTRNDMNGDYLCDTGEGTCADIYAQAVSPSGALVGPEFPVLKMDGNQMFAQLIYDGSRYLTYWMNTGVFFGSAGDIYGRFLKTPLSANNDLLVDFGASGLWAKYNDATWSKLHTLSPTLTATGDIDGSGMDEALAVFSPYGIYARYNNAGPWTRIHTLVPSAIATGDMDGGGADELIAVFSAYGVYARYNDAGDWTRLTSLVPEQVVMADLDGSGQSDLICDFGAMGIWAKYDNGAWTKILGANPALMAAGDLDGGGMDELIAYFPAFGGIWTKMNNAGWTKLHALAPESIVTADLDGTGKDEVIVDFGVHGIWAKYDNTTWTKLHALSPDSMTTGDLDGSGRYDLVADFGAFGIYARYDDGAWTRIHTSDPELMATGNLDGN